MFNCQKCKKLSNTTEETESIRDNGETDYQIYGETVEYFERRKRTCTYQDIRIFSNIPCISKINLITRTLLLDKIIFFRPKYLQIAFHLGKNGVHPQLITIVSRKAKRTLTTILDKDEERRS